MLSKAIDDRVVTGRSREVGNTRENEGGNGRDYSLSSGEDEWGIYMLNKVANECTCRRQAAWRGRESESQY